MQPRALRKLTAVLAFAVAAGCDGSSPSPSAAPSGPAATSPAAGPTPDPALAALPAPLRATLGGTVRYAQRRMASAAEVGRCRAVHSGSPGTVRGVLAAHGAGVGVVVLRLDGGELFCDEAGGEPARGVCASGRHLAADTDAALARRGREANDCGGHAFLSVRVTGARWLAVRQASGWVVHDVPAGLPQRIWTDVAQPSGDQRHASTVTFAADGKVATRTTITGFRAS